MPEVIVVLEKLFHLPLTERATLCEITDEKDANFVRSERLAIVPRDEPKLVARMRDELLDGEVFDTLLEAKVLIERWRAQYNTKRRIHRWVTGRRHRKCCGHCRHPWGLRPCGRQQ